MRIVKGIIAVRQRYSVMKVVTGECDEKPNDE